LARGSLILGQHYVIRSAYYRASMDRLRPLSESDCYTRLYGQRDPTVTIVSRETRTPPWPTVSGEELREAFDERLDVSGRLDSPGGLGFDAEAA
jgi:hypothetical protein